MSLAERALVVSPKVKLLGVRILSRSGDFGNLQFVYVHVFIYGMVFR